MAKKTRKPAAPKTQRTRAAAAKKSPIIGDVVNFVLSVRSEPIFDKNMKDTGKVDEIKTIRPAVVLVEHGDGRLDLNVQLDAVRDEKAAAELGLQGPIRSAVKTANLVQNGEGAGCWF